MSKVILTGYVIIPENERELYEAAIPIHLKLTRAEPGCLKFTIAADKNDPCRFSLYEEFKDQAAFDHHQTRTEASNWAKISVNMKRHFSVLAE